MLGSVCGAFKGVDGVPAEWVETVQSAIDRNRYTLQKMSMRGTAEKLTAALGENAARLRRQVDAIAALEGG